MIWKKKKAPKGSTRKTNENLLELVKLWVGNGYFDKKGDGLEIYKKILADGGIPFRFSELEKCLKIVCGSEYTLLQKKSMDGVLRYWRKR